MLRVWIHSIPLLCGLSLALPVRADALAEAEGLMQSGRLHQAVARLQGAQGAEAEALRGRVWLQLGRLDEAETALRAALQAGAKAARLDLAELALRRGQPDAAQALLLEAQRDVTEPLPLRQRAELALAALDPPATRLARLRAIEPGLLDAELLLQLARLAQADATLAERALLRVQGTSRQRAQALDLRAGLAEATGQGATAAGLNTEALTLLAGLPEAQQADLRVALEWRAARLQPGTPAALAALQRSVAQLEAARDDWPLSDAQGRSTHQTLFQPLYLQLVDALLRRADMAQGDERQAWLRRARDALEQLHQAELQDYLGDRCEVDAVKGGGAGGLPPDAAAIYPLLLPDRVALLVEDARGLDSFDSKAAPAALRESASLLAKRLRERQPGYLSAARALHDALLLPIEPWLQQRGIRTLVWVNDGVLRLVPMAVLYDGEKHLLERYRSANVLGMSMTNTQAGGGAPLQALVAGAGRFGGVVEKLASEAWAQPLRRQLLGAVAETDATADPATTRSLQETRLREALELPGVSDELKTLVSLLPMRAPLQDAGFTVAAFSTQVRRGGHRVVHIASHGVFGGSAATSFLLAYDDLLTLGGLQGLLQSEATRRQPIELLTLSACQTAEGNERAPLGLSGAAIKARARAVLGTLWPVDDAATVQLMAGFYRGWTALPAEGKAEALRAAQRTLLKNAETRHPYYWAPFALIGNWL